jgi:hypothetical protein
MNRSRMLVALVTLVIILATSSVAWAATVTQNVYLEIVRKTLPDATTSWAVEAVGVAVSSGLMEGYPDKTFKPERKVTGAEFITILVRFLGLESAVDPKAVVPGNVTAPTWAKGHVAQLVKIGVVESGAVFNTEGDLTREKMAILLARALGLTPVTGTLAFKDAMDASLTARGYILALVNAGVIKGYPDGTFGPNRTLSRAETAILIQQILAKYGKK